MTPRLSEKELLAWLDAQNIPYTLVEHPPVMTCEEADRYRPALPAVHIKNILVRDEKRMQHFLVVAPCSKRIDLQELGVVLQVRKLHFASPEVLLELLGVTAGAVSILGLVNDASCRVEPVFDKDIWESEAFLCHPLVNTATLVIQRADLLRFLELTGHAPRVVSMQAKI